MKLSSCVPVLSGTKLINITVHTSSHYSTSCMLLPWWTYSPDRGLHAALWKPSGDFSGQMWFLQLAPFLGKGWWWGLTLHHTHGMMECAPFKMNTKIVSRNIQQNLACLYLLVIWSTVLKYLIGTQTLEIHSQSQTSFTYIWELSLLHPYLPYLSAQLTQHLSWGILVHSLHWWAIKHFCDVKVKKSGQQVIYLHLQNTAFSPENEPDPDFHQFPILQKWVLSGKSTACLSSMFILKTKA